MSTWEWIGIGLGAALVAVAVYDLLQKKRAVLRNFPIIGRIDSGWVVKELGWPYLPIAPMFPLAPIPIPSKWHVRVLEPVGMQGLKPADAENVKLVRDFSRYIQDIVQRNIDDMLPRRTSIFWGKKVLNGTAPAVTPFPIHKHEHGADVRTSRAAG